MTLTPKKINRFTLFKLPLVFLSGIRVIDISETTCTAHVRFQWINQNPFRSMFWAVQGMAAELTTGALVIQAIQEESKSVSMILTSTKANFNKKARGRILFQCNDGEKIIQMVRESVATGEGKSSWFTSIGVDEEGENVSEFHFEWSVKPRR